MAMKTLTPAELFSLKFLPSPPVEWMKLREAMLRSIEGRGLCVPVRRMEAEFARLHGFKRSERPYPWRILGRYRTPWRKPFPFDDHTDLWLRAQRAVVWTSQPYVVNTDTLLTFARRHALRFAVSEEWSWWYPGRTKLIWWERA